MGGKGVLCGWMGGFGVCGGQEEMDACRATREEGKLIQRVSRAFSQGPPPPQTSNSEGGKRSMELSYESTELAPGVLVKNIKEVNNEMRFLFTFVFGAS